MCQTLSDLFGGTMEQEKHVRKTIRLPLELVKQIENSNIEFSEFARTALQNELQANTDAQREVRRLNRKIDAMDAKSIHGTLSDLVYRIQVIYEENKKQNEMLKLIHESSSLAGTFSYEKWSEDQTEEDAKKWFDAVIKDAKDEIKQVDL